MPAVPHDSARLNSWEHILTRLETALRHAEAEARERAAAFEPSQPRDELPGQQPSTEYLARPLADLAQCVGRAELAVREVETTLDGERAILEAWRQAMHASQARLATGGSEPL